MKVRRFPYKKYNNCSCLCNGQDAKIGETIPSWKLRHQHGSRFEADYCDQLKLLVKAGEIQEFEYSVRYILKVNDKTICEHWPDFLVTRNDGGQEVHETKGFATKEWGLKRKLFEALYPNIPYIVIVQQQKRRPSWMPKKRVLKRKSQPIREL